MNRFATLLSAFSALCTFALGQTQVVSLPSVQIMSVDASGHQHVAAPDYELTLDAVPLSTTSISFEFNEQDAPLVGMENLTGAAIHPNLNMGVIHSFTYRAWTHRSDYWWQDGYWSEEGIFEHGSDLQPWQWKHPIGNSGVSNIYPVTLNLGAYDGNVDWAGPSGWYGSGPICNGWIQWSIDSPPEIAFFKRGDVNGKVHIHYNPRALIDLDVAHYSDAAWECSYQTNVGMLFVTAH